MKIGIVGAGFTGLSAAIKLQKAGHTVHIFEKEAIAGGLAMGFKQKNWEWALEKHYHHIFTSDTAIQRLANEVGCPFTFQRPVTSSLINGDILQLDSPVKLLQFSKLSRSDRMRMAAVLGYLRYVADWHILESETSHEWLQKMLGKKAYSMLWEPLLIGKFGTYYKDISLAWFWARIKARTTQLGYPEGGFQKLADVLAQTVVKNDGKISYRSTVKKITKSTKIEVEVDEEGKKNIYKFDRVLVTLPNIQFNAIAPDLPNDYKKKLRDFEGIGAVNMVLELSEPFLKDNVYWLNICEKEYPFLAVVEHTNFVNKSHYDNKYILYVGNYLPHGHKYFSFKPEELLKEYDPYLKKLKKDYKNTVLNISLFKVPFAQPIVRKNFSEKILPFVTPLQGVYLSNMQQVYPWDRGTNFAVEMGERVAEEIIDRKKVGTIRE
ncbi:NAD(P)/FAD-dependent oxidoreductase [soil metagenome]